MKTIFLLALVSTSALAQDGATVIVLRGNAHTESGKLLSLKDQVPPGTQITTEAKSYVKLLFPDQTQMNIGPSSSLKLEITKLSEASLVNLVAGQLRAKVTKDPLAPGTNRKDKMVVKTRSAAMGIRGTDFDVTFNPANNITSLLTFEGNVAMVQIEANQNAAAALRAEVNLQHVTAGLFSGAQPGFTQASVPVRISPMQLDALKKNVSFDGLGEKPEIKSVSYQSPIPPGMDPKSFSSGAAVSLNAHGGVAPMGQQSMSQAGGPPPEGFYNAKTGAYAPRAGGFLDLVTGRYVPPPAGSAFDPAAGVYVPPKALGEVNPTTGMYVAPKGMELDAVKGFVPETNSRNPSSTGNSAAAALNAATSVASAGKTVGFEKIGGATIAGAGAIRIESPPIAALPPQPKAPVDDPYCPTCLRDNIETLPTKTTVRFKITPI